MYKNGKLGVDIGKRKRYALFITRIDYGRESAPESEAPTLVSHYAKTGDKYKNSSARMPQVRK